MYSFLLLPLCFGLVWGHAALYEPPGRSSMWRFGFKTPVNDDDAELYCGGITKLWKINKGKCGICGDAWDLPEPRPNEDGGKYGKGIVVRTYKAGQEFTSTVFIVANHEGYFEFKLCPVKPGVKIDQNCLDQHPVGLADGSGNRYILKRGIKGNLDIKLKLPNGLKCDRCVLQYHWKAANNWGICEDGKGRMGCGPQEYFRACADIRIE
ncbi:chitin-binding type-4 domain-containing protein [Trichonephila clavata]|uniref:Chitin-binding type-4 domain-containing protein n=1 Tax=Trichonephila clavata TaxID=2740835 RepID=A0A8X6KQ21_TRICU|nr:chitin-binding type-4 domain-containing protein [Trichonephila clavata]